MLDGAWCLIVFVDRRWWWLASGTCVNFTVRARPLKKRALCVLNPTHPQQQGKPEITQHPKSQQASAGFRVQPPPSKVSTSHIFEQLLRSSTGLRPESSSSISFPSCRQILLLLPTSSHFAIPPDGSSRPICPALTSIRFSAQDGGHVSQRQCSTSTAHPHSRVAILAR
jgi:hypothetical protein